MQDSRDNPAINIEPHQFIVGNTYARRALLGVRLGELSHAGIMTLTRAALKITEDVVRAPEM